MWCMRWRSLMERSPRRACALPAGMAPAERGALMTLARDLSRGAGIAVVFTEHDMDVVFAVADRIIAAAPRAGGSRREEGSILGGLGDLLDGDG